MSLEPRPPAAGRLLTPGAPPAYFAPTIAGVRHGFFGRQGGVSTGIYASLNAGPGSRDDPDAVLENRRRIAAAFALPSERLVSLHQVHSAICINVSAPWEGPRPEADALVTTTPKLALSILTADCAPVLFADAEAGVIGAAHAGWKGALGGVLEATIAEMRKAGATHIGAAIGPCIHQDSYEVGPDFVERFGPQNARFFRAGAGDRSFFDLPGYCAERLKAAGLSRIEIVARDTYTAHESLFSHRRSVHDVESDYGRNCAVIALTK